MKVGIVLLVLIVAVGFVQWIKLHKNPPKIDFYIALHPNRGGISWLRNHVLNHISNPNSPHYGEFLSTYTINNIVRPPLTDIKLVTDWLAEYDIEYKVLGDTIHCRGNIFTINKMVGTNFGNFGNFGSNIGSHANYRIPTHLKDTVQFIDGLVYRPYHFTVHKPKRNYDKSVSNGYVTREVMERVYNMVGQGLTRNIATSVGAMEYEGQSGFSQKDMVAAQVASDVPPHNVSVDHIIGLNNLPDGESQLDMAVIWWGNGDATLWYEDYKGWMFGWASSFLNRKEYPEVVSISWGWNERDQCTITSCFNETSKQYVQRANDEFMKLAAKGVTILVSSGDAGSPGRTNEDCSNVNSPINPVFPGSSEWVTSVGATYIVSSDQKHKWVTPLCKEVSCANGTVEQITTYDKTSWTSGSGWAWWVKTPEWQQSQVKSYLGSGVYLPKLYNNNGTLRWNKYGRGYPDVSTFGHSCTIHGGNGWYTEDGTSCSSPIFAGIIAYLNDHQRSRNKPILGFANPVLYRMYEDDPTTFNDITVGNSSCTEYGCCDRDHGFVPTKGWDVVSGLGTPNIGNMIKWLDTHT